MLIIRNGRVIDPKSNLDHVMNLVVEKGRIQKMIPVEQSDSLGNIDAQVLDATGLVIAPGLVDIHVHFRDPGLTYKEDIQTGAAAAAAGGYTSVVMMANTKPVIDNTKSLSYVLKKGRKTGIHVYSCATVTKGMQGQELTDMEALKAAGAVGFTDDGKPILNEKVALQAFRKVSELGVPISLHEEDPLFIQNNGINHGAVSDKLGLGGSDHTAEEVMVARDCLLALYTGAKVNIQHLSSRHSVEIIRLAKSMGAPVTAEVTPHHFTLDDTAVLQYGTLAKMNPPLRTAEDREALIGGLADGTIDFIATDHAPHSREEKAKPLSEAPSGIIGLETALGLAVTELVYPDRLPLPGMPIPSDQDPIRIGGLPLMEVIRKMSTAPSQLYGLDAGYIAEGGPADLVIFNPEETWTVPETFHSKAVNTPFIGWTLYGKIHATICGGQIVYGTEGNGNILQRREADTI